MVFGLVKDIKIGEYRTVTRSDNFYDKIEVE
jgi:hypothetical protein